MRICYYARNQTLASDIQAHTNACNRIADRLYLYERNQLLHNYDGRMEEHYQSIIRTVYDTPYIQFGEKKRGEKIENEINNERRVQWK